jgi:hypothetical protein
MIALGSANSRMKDFYDVWTCSNHLEFSGATLREAVAATFRNRETPVPAEEPEAFAADFVDEHRVQWNAFVKKMGEGGLTDALGRVVEDLKSFVMPVLRAISRDERFARNWKAGGRWS